MPDEIYSSKKGQKIILNLINWLEKIKNYKNTFFSLVYKFKPELKKRSLLNNRKKMTENKNINKFLKRQKEVMKRQEVLKIL